MTTTSYRDVRREGARRVPARGPQGRRRRSASFLERLLYQPLDAIDARRLRRSSPRSSATSRAGSRSSCRPRRRCSSRRSRGSNRPASPASTVRIGLEKPLGYDLASSREINDTVADGLPRGPHLPHRPLSRQGNRPEHPGAALRQFACSSRSGTRRASTTSRSPSPRRSGWKSARAIMTAPARCATWSQNHMLQLLALIAMEPPARFDGTAIRDEKAKVFRSLRQITPEEAPHAHRHRPIWRGRGRRRDRQGLCRRTRQAFDHRDLRRDQGACRQLALAGRALLSAHRQAHGRRGAARSRSSSSRCRIRCSPSAAACSSPTRWSSACSPRNMSSCW